jgi:Cytosol aminopeptidase family, catalytic domain
VAGELVAEAVAIAEAHGAFDVAVVAGEQLLEQNYPAIHTVGRASSRPPQLVSFRWQPAGAASPSELPLLALVGKVKTDRHAHARPAGVCSPRDPTLVGVRWDEAARFRPPVVGRRRWTDARGSEVSRTGCGTMRMDRCRKQRGFAHRLRERLLPRASGRWPQLAVPSAGLGLPWCPLLQASLVLRLGTFSCAADRRPCRTKQERQVKHAAALRDQMSYSACQIGPSVSYWSTQSCPRCAEWGCPVPRRALRGAAPVPGAAPGPHRPSGPQFEPAAFRLQQPLSCSCCACRG